MHWRASVVGVAFLMTACLTANPGPFDGEGSEDDRGWESFSVSSIKAVSASQNATFFVAQADSSFRMGLLNAPVGSTVGMVTHRDNAVYYVAAGSAEFRVSGDTIPVEAGSVVFMPGDTEHRIRDVTAELDVVVFLARGLALPEEPEVRVYTADELAGPMGDTNEWRLLLESSTLGLGVYTLPKGGGGDEGLSHDFVEYKLVMAGGGRFDVGGGGIEAAPGSMVLIPDDVQHQFRRVSDDLAILVVWKR